MDYKACWEYQEKLFNEIVQQKISNRDLPAEKQIPTKNYLLFDEPLQRTGIVLVKILWVCLLIKWFMEKFAIYL
jgi:hypothetical protein